ncbi:MAG: HAD-IA family hydrolase, partial [Microbacteriaceae bacterium]
VHTAAGPLATVAGKPEVPIFEEALERFGISQALMVGDRLDTDIMGAKRAGIKSALVLTGIDGPKQVLASGVEQQPDFILNDLRELHLPYPQAIRSEHNGQPVVTVGKAAVTLRDQVHVEILSRDEDPTNLLRAACQLIWPTNRAIFGFYVDEEIFSYR